MTDTRRWGDRPAVLAAHAAVLALGLALAAPVLVHRPHPQLASNAWTGPSQDRSGTPRNPMAFEPAGSATEEGLVGSIDVVPGRPVQAPAPPTGVAVAPAGSGVGVQAIYAVFGESPGLAWALRVARCESRYNPVAVNRASGASGLFQFMPSTWNAHFASWNIWDPYAQARAALAFYNHGATNAWTCK